MLMTDEQNLLFCDARDRDGIPAGQMLDDTRPLSGSQRGPERHPASAPLGTTAGGGGNDVDGRASRRRTSADAAAAVVVRCVHCRARLRWAGRRSGRTRCPKCRKRLILRSVGPGNWAVLPENDDSVAGMICDWLGQRSLDGNSDS
jgi:hypothetical protein